MINENQTIAIKQNPALPCPVCHEPMAFQIARGRRSGKAFLMVKCLRDGRHFRGFINHRPFVEGLIQNLENLTRGNKLNNDETDKEITKK